MKELIDDDGEKWWESFPPELKRKEVISESASKDNVGIVRKT